MPHLYKLATAIVVASSIAGCASAPDIPSKSVKTETAKMDMASYPVASGSTDTGVIIKSEAMSDVTPAPATVAATATPKGKTIMAHASAADNLTTLTALIAQAQLGETLSGAGPFTVFAPSDAAFSTLPSATRESLMADANRATLQTILKNHVLPSRLTADDLLFNIERSGGAFKTTTVEGVELSFFSVGDKVKISDGRGYVATVTTADLDQSNGIIHVINSVLLPE